MLFAGICNSLCVPNCVASTRSFTTGGSAMQGSGRGRKRQTARSHRHSGSDRRWLDALCAAAIISRLTNTQHNTHRVTWISSSLVSPPVLPLSPPLCLTAGFSPFFLFTLANLPHHHHILLLSLPLSRLFFFTSSLPPSAPRFLCTSNPLHRPSFSPTFSCLVPRFLCFCP